MSERDIMSFHKVPSSSNMNHSKSQSQSQLLNQQRSSHLQNQTQTHGRTDQSNMYDENLSRLMHHQKNFLTNNEVISESDEEENLLQQEENRVKSYLDQVSMPDNMQHNFFENLNVLYSRRLTSAQSLIEQLQNQKQKVHNWSRYLANLQIQLQQNQHSCENEIRLKKQQLLLELERLYEAAIRDIDFQSKIKLEKILEKIQEVDEYGQQVDQVIDMIQLRIKAENQQKFVSNYPNTIKQAEEVLQKNLRIDQYFEEMVVQLKIKAPFFNYILGQKDHRGDFISLSSKMRLPQRSSLGSGNYETTPISKVAPSNEKNSQTRSQNFKQNLLGQKYSQNTTPKPILKETHNSHPNLQAPKENINIRSNYSNNASQLLNQSEVQIIEDSPPPADKTENKRMSNISKIIDSAKKEVHLQEAKRKIFDKIDELEKLINHNQAKSMEKVKKKKSHSKSGKSGKIKSKYQGQLPPQPVNFMAENSFNARRVSGVSQGNVSGSNFFGGPQYQTYTPNQNLRQPQVSEMKPLNIDFNQLNSERQFQSIALSALHSEPISEDNSMLSGKNYQSAQMSSNNTDLGRRKVRLYIPFGYPPYSCFYMLQIQDHVTTKELLGYLMEHLKISADKFREYQISYKLDAYSVDIKFESQEFPMQTLRARVGSKVGKKVQNDEESATWPRIYLVNVNDQQY